MGARRVLRATTRRRDGLGQQRRRAFDRRGRSKGRPRSFAALGRRSESRGRRRLARRTRDVRGRARRAFTGLVREIDARRVLEHRSPGIGHTALHWSASRGIDALDATAWLLDVCLDDVIETNDEKTETNAGAKNRREKSAKKRGLDPNARNLEGATPLHAAAGIGSMEALALLAASGADPRVRDEAGETAADVAARRGHASFAPACRDGEAVFSRVDLGTEARVSRRPASGRSRRARASARVVSRRRRSLERAPNRTAATTRRREPRSSPRRPPRRGARGTRRSRRASSRRR